MEFKSRNPFLKNKAFSDSKAARPEVHQAVLIDYNESMTVSGTMNKSFLLLLLLVAGAFVSWWLTYSGSNTMPIALGSVIVGIVLVFMTVWRPQYSGYLAPG